MSKTTYRHAITANNIINTKSPKDIDDMFLFGDIIVDLSIILDRYNSVLDRLQEKHAEKDNNGSIVKNGNVVVVKDQELFQSELAELLEKEVEYNSWLIPKSKLIEFGFKANELGFIRFLIDSSK